MSDADPPQWADRERERWTIDGLLGLYERQPRQITIFTKGIAYAAGKLDCTADALEYIVRNHEWAHAVFHLGVDGETNTLLTKASLDGNARVKSDTLSALTAGFLAVDSFVHEQIAQALTWLVLRKLHEDASLDDARRVCASLGKTFETLTRRQPFAQAVRFKVSETIEPVLPNDGCRRRRWGSRWQRRYRDLSGSSGQGGLRTSCGR
jgi:hypothetical protein